MKVKYNTDIISGIVFSVVGIVLWLLIPTQIPTMEKTMINAQTLPKIAIGGLVIFAVGLLIEGLFFHPKKTVIINKALFKTPEVRKEFKSLIYIAFLVAYCVAIKPVGFLISTIVLVILIMLYYGARKWYYYAIPLGMIAIVYYVFKVLLHVSLP